MFKSHDDAIVTLLHHPIGSILHEDLVHNDYIQYLHGLGQIRYIQKVAKYHQYTVFGNG